MPNLGRAVALLLFLSAAASNAAIPAPTNTDLTPGVINAAAPPYSAPRTASPTTPCAANASNDATQEIQLALDFAANNYGAIVFLPTGLYCVAGHLTVHGASTLKGEFSSPSSNAASLDFGT